MLTHHDQIDRASLFVQKVWTGDQDLVTRAGRYSGARMPVATSATLASQKSHYTGLDGRFLRNL